MPRFVSDTRELTSQESIPPHSNPCAPAAAPSERLLDALCRAPVDQGVEAAALFMLESLSLLLPAVSCGLRSSGGPHARLLTPSQTRATPLDGDDSRMFAGLARERAFPTDDPPGWTLHYASNEVDLQHDDTPLARVLRLGVEAVASAMRTAATIDAERRKARELQQLQASMVQTEKLASLGEISAGVVHELSNPLTSIVTYAEYLLRSAERSQADPQDIERLRRISQSAERILEFARALVSYARPDDDPPEAVDLRQVLDKSLVFCEHLVHESRTEVLCSVPDTLPPVSGSHGQLIQVFVNLITNACHAMSASGGTLRIEASYPGSGKPVTVTLLDTGPGILPENLPRVFEPFFTTKDKASGTGLGLSVVRHIVTRSGGQVSAQSPGRGALFTITLPPHWADERPTDPR